MQVSGSCGCLCQAGYSIVSAPVARQVCLRLSPFDTWKFHSILDVMFELVSDYAPAGDQPQAIEKLTAGILSGAKAQTLRGVTGSGKTFTVANVIKNTGKPTLVISHNKTLAA